MLSLFLPCPSSKPQDKTPFSQVTGKSPSSSKPPPPVLQPSVESGTPAVLVFSSETSSPLPCPLPSSSRAWSLTTCSGFVLHDHKPGNKMYLPPVFPEWHGNFFSLLLSSCKLSLSYQTQPFLPNSALLTTLTVLM